MTDNKNSERVIAEISLSHLMRLGNEQDCSVSREQGLASLNQEGRAFETWKHMMQALSSSTLLLQGICSQRGREK